MRALVCVAVGGIEPIAQTFRRDPHQYQSIVEGIQGHSSIQNIIGRINLEPAIALAVGGTGQAAIVQQQLIAIIDRPHIGSVITLEGGDGGATQLIEARFFIKGFQRDRVGLALQIVQRQLGSQTKDRLILLVSQGQNRPPYLAIGIQQQIRRGDRPRFVDEGRWRRDALATDLADPHQAIGLAQQLFQAIVARGHGKIPHQIQPNHPGFILFQRFQQVRQLFIGQGPLPKQAQVRFRHHHQHHPLLQTGRPPPHQQIKRGPLCPLHPAQPPHHHHHHRHQQGDRCPIAPRQQH